MVYVQLNQTLQDTCLHSRSSTPRSPQFVAPPRQVGEAQEGLVVLQPVPLCVQESHKGPHHLVYLWGGVKRGTGGGYDPLVPDIYRHPALEFPKPLSTHWSGLTLMMILKGRITPFTLQMRGVPQGTALSQAELGLDTRRLQFIALSVTTPWPSQARGRVTRRKAPRSRGDPSHCPIPSTQTPTRSPGNAMSGLETAAIFARAWAAFTLPTSVPSKARGIRACKKGHGHSWVTDIL